MLQGERVVLRAIERDDLEALWKFANDAELQGLTQDYAPRPQSFAELEADFDRRIEQEVTDPYFGIEVDGELIGHCGLIELDALSRRCRCYITIWQRSYWGQGYGAEALTLLVDHAFRDHGMRRVWLDVLADNERAIRAYKAAGFTEEGRAREHAWHDGCFKDLVFMGVLKGEWEERRAHG